MATVTAPEHVERQARAEPAAVKPAREAVQKISIEGSTLAVLGVGIALFTMAFGAFTHLSGRIDGLDSKLGGRIDGLDAKIERLATDLRADIKDVNAKIDKLSAETNDKFDRLNEKITQILINQTRGQ